MIWERIVIHHTAGADRAGLEAEAIRQFHMGERGWSDIGYHFLVERVGAAYWVLCGRPLHHVGAHVRGKNRGSIGVALVGDFTDSPPGSEQLEVAARLVAGLLTALEIPIREVCGHASLSNNPTECPGAWFPWLEFLEMVEDRL